MDNRLDSKSLVQQFDSRSRHHAFVAQLVEQLGEVINKKCKSCGLTIIKINTYCNNVCQKDYEYKKFILNWKNGTVPGWTGKTRQISKHIRRYLYKTRGTSCSVCGWDKKHPVDGRVLTEIDHIDGNSENCKEDNLRILCPNCHSMTETFRARNKKSKRIRRCS